MTKNDPSASRVAKPRASKSRFPVLGTVAGVLAAGAIAWFIVERFDVPSVMPSSAQVADGARSTPKALSKPLWDQLSSAQQVALAPLEPEWNRMEGPRKRKWIEMSARFASMPVSEQQRVHERMRQWMKLTPAQRELARENFSKTKRLAQGEKAANWENYKQLSEAEKRQLARTQPAARNKSVPIALPEAPMLVVPTPCPPNTTRRGAECVLIGTENVAPPSDTAGVAPVTTPENSSASSASSATAHPATPGAAAPGVLAAPGGQGAPAQAANAGN